MGVWCTVGAVSYLAIGSDKGVFTSRNLFQDTITQVFHEHLFLRFHISDHQVMESRVGVLLEMKFVFHDASSAFLIPHLNKDCPQGRLGSVGLS